MSSREKVEDPSANLSTAHTIGVRVQGEKTFCGTRAAKTLTPLEPMFSATTAQPVWKTEEKHVPFFRQGFFDHFRAFSRDVKLVMTADEVMRLTRGSEDEDAR